MKCAIGAKTLVYFTPTLFLVTALLFCSAAAGADVAEYRTGKPETRTGSVPDEIRQAIFTQPAETVEPLVRWLVRNVKDDFRKVKILHDWVADNIDYDIEAYLAGRPGRRPGKKRSPAARHSAKAMPNCSRKCARSPAFPAK